MKLNRLWVYSISSGYYWATEEFDNILDSTLYIGTIYGIMYMYNMYLCLYDECMLMLCECIKRYNICIYSLVPTYLQQYTCALKSLYFRCRPFSTRFFPIQTRLTSPTLQSAAVRGPLTFGGQCCCYYYYYYRRRCCCCS